MANFKKTVNYIAGGVTTGVSSLLKTYKEAVNYELIVDNTDTGTKILAVDPEGRASSEDWSDIKSLCIQCIDKQPVEVILKTLTWTNDTTASGNDYIHTILTEGEMINIPNAKLITYNPSRRDPTKPLLFSGEGSSTTY